MWLNLKEFSLRISLIRSPEHVVGIGGLTNSALRMILTDDFNSILLPLRTKKDFFAFARRVSM